MVGEKNKKMNNFVPLIKEDAFRDDGEWKREETGKVG